VREIRIGGIAVGVVLISLAGIGIFVALILVAWFTGESASTDADECIGGSGQGYFWAMLAIAVAAGASAVTTLSFAILRRSFAVPAVVTLALLAAQVALFFLAPDVPSEINFGQC
jgi:hypothetical protein